MTTLTSPARLDPYTLDFELPETLEAKMPPEARGIARDAVQLMVSYQSDDRIVHALFRDLASFLAPGDLLVVNTSGTLPAALPAWHPDGQALRLHLSNRRDDDHWVVELRHLDAHDNTQPFLSGEVGERYALPAGGYLTLLDPLAGQAPGKRRLWLARFHWPQPWGRFLQLYGRPIRYNYVREPWSIDYYQTAFSRHYGSAEMPSAGRGFTPQLITQLVTRGIQFAPITLHTGVASLEADEPPYPEWFSVPAASADLLNLAQAGGRRIIGIGTTAVRAVESAVTVSGQVIARSGWTGRLISPADPPQIINGLLTGLHEPRATHLAMLAALADEDHLRLAYAEALAERYLWHEFGDLHLLLS